MILSLADDTDQEFMEDVTLEEAEAFEVKEESHLFSRGYHRAVKNVNSSFACKTRTEGRENAFKALNAILGIVTELRKNAKIPEKGEQSLANLKEGNTSSILHFPMGKKCQNSQKSGSSMLFWQGQSKADEHSEKLNSLK